MLVEYSENKSEEGVKWWGWILIIISFIIVACGVTLAVIKFQ